MEQPTLSSNYPTIPTIHDIASLAEQRYRPPLLRRVSRSDPHIDESAAHLVSSALETHSNGNALMPFDQKRSASVVPTSATGPNQQPEAIERNLSALNLGLLGANDDNSNIGPLRKASSFIHGTSFGIGRKPSTSSLLHLPPSFQIGGNVSHIAYSVSPAPEDAHHQPNGLSMSVTSNSLAVKPNNEIQHSASMGGGLFSGPNTDNSSNRVTSGIVPNNSSESLNSATHRSGVMGVFGRGFFAKPMRSEEENYRYIMALDR